MIHSGWRGGVTIARIVRLFWCLNWHHSSIGIRAGRRSIEVLSGLMIALDIEFRIREPESDLIRYVDIGILWPWGWLLAFWWHYWPFWIHRG
jgi:hypothetical protein